LGTLRFALAMAVLISHLPLVGWKILGGGPVYLTHLMIIGLVLHFEPPQPVWIAIGGTLALSVGLRYALEIPIDRRRQARALSFPRSPVVARPQTPLPQPN
jgi:hypothetical protein